MKIVQENTGRKETESIRKNVNRKQQGKFLLEKSYTKTAAQIGKTNLCGCKPNFMELKRKQSRLRQKRPNCPEYAGTCKQHDDACKENTAHDGENAGLKVHIEDTCGQCAGPCAGSRERDADEEQQASGSPRPAFAFSFSPPFSPFSRHQVKNFRYTFYHIPRQEPFERTGK